MANESRFQFLFGVGSGTGSRPPSGNAGARWIDTTGPTESYDDGSAWHNLGGGGSAWSWQWIAKTANYTAAAGDFVKGDASGGPFTVSPPSASGVTQPIAVMKRDSSANKITVSGIINGASSKVLSLQDDVLILVSDGTNWEIAAQHLGDVVQLDFAASTDVNGTTLSTQTWTDLFANQNFTVDDVNSLIEISVSCGAQQSTAANTASRVNVDSGGTPIIKMLGLGPGSSGANPFSGAGLVPITVSATGTHTVKAQLYANSGGTIYCRASTLPNVEFFSLRVIERKR